MTTSRSQLIEVLSRTGRIDKNTITAVLAEKQVDNQSIEQILSSMGIIAGGEAGAILEKYFNVPYVQLDESKFDTELLKLIPEEVIRRHKVIPINCKDSELSVAMCFPNDLVVIDDIQIITGYTVKPFVALEAEIEVIIEKYYSVDCMDKTIQKLVSDILPVVENDDTSDSAVIRGEADKAPVIELVNTILVDAVRLGASDIHIEPQEKGVFIRYRINSLLRMKELIPKELQPAITSRIKVMADLNITERRMPQDGQFGMHINKRNIDFRVSTLPAKYGEKIVMRVLDKSNFALGIEHLGFLPDTQTRFEEILSGSSGIILVTGPTGSGKTTTLYSAVNKIKSSEKNIITLEDPIEFDLLSGKAKENGITQVQINSKVGFSFACSLRACMRQDPDVILVGEIRDEETCRTAINAALTGHLVLSTIHTNDAVSTVTRLLDMGIEPYLITSSLSGIVAQRLVRALCRHCKQPYFPPERIIKTLNSKYLPVQGQVTFYRPKGCSHCDNTGYKGRVGIYELLIVNENIRDIILEKSKLSVLKDAAIKGGMVTMKQNGIHLVLQGVTTMAEIMRVLPSVI